MTLLRFETTVTGDVAVVTFAGELDVAGAALLERELKRIVSEHQPRRIVFDLAHLDFMDSTGLRLVVLADADSAYELVLVRGPADVQRVFELTRMVDRLTFADSVAEATG